jgi:hypothetical protein
MSGVLAALVAGTSRDTIWPVSPLARIAMIEIWVILLTPGLRSFRIRVRAFAGRGASGPEASGLALRALEIR